MINDFNDEDLSADEKNVLKCSIENKLNIDVLKGNKALKINKISISDTIKSLQRRDVIACTELRYDFKTPK